MLFTAAGGLLVASASQIMMGGKTSAIGAMIGLMTGTVSSAAGSNINAATIGAYPTSIIVDERAAHAFVANQEGMIQILDTRTGTLVQTVAIGGQRHSMAIDQHTGRLFVVNMTAEGIGTSVSVLDSHNGRLLRTTTSTINPHGLTVDETERLVFVGVKNGVTVLDAQTGTSLRTIRLPMQGVPVWVKVDTQLKRLFVAHEGMTANGLMPIQGGISTVSTIDIRTGAVIHTARVGVEPDLAVLNERTSRLFIVSRVDMTIDVVNTHDGSIIHKIPLHARSVPPDGIAMDTRAGRLILVSSGNGQGGIGYVTFLDAKVGSILNTIAFSHYPWSVAVDERRARAYVASNGGTHVLDTRTGAILNVINAAGGMVALDRRMQHLIVLGNITTDTHNSKVAWAQGLRRWVQELPHTSKQDSSIQALTIDVSR